MPTDKSPSFNGLAQLRTWAALALSLALASACGDDPTIEGTPAATADTGTGQDVALDSTELEVEQDADPGTDVQAIDLGTADVPYKVIPCEKNEDCDSLVCQPTPKGKECAQP